jgi:hypothetical protein
VWGSNSQLALNWFAKVRTVFLWSKTEAIYLFEKYSWAEFWSAF